MAVLHSIPMKDFLDGYPQALRNWIELDLGWKTEEITEILLVREVLPDGSIEGPDGQMLAKYKQGPHVATRAWRGKEKQDVIFDTDQGWQKAKFDDVTSVIDRWMDAVSS